MRAGIYILFACYVPDVKGMAPPAVPPKGMSAASGIVRTFPRVAKDAARVEGSFLRVSDARYGILAKYNSPMSKGKAVPLATPLPVPPRV